MFLWTNHKCEFVCFLLWSSTQGIEIKLGIEKNRKNKISQERKTNFKGG